MNKSAMKGKDNSISNFDIIGALGDYSKLIFEVTK